MDKYGHSSKEDTKEYFDTRATLEEKAERLAAMINESKHLVIFTGAGISTSVGIPDFRSGTNTVLKTGAGLWELKSAKQAGKKIVMNRACPSLTHMSIVKLLQEGICKFLISQNIDGLHRKSGISYAQIAELHGNRNLEICKKCGKHYLRDYRTRTALAVHDHKTGRICDNPKCGGELYDTIINFEENLPERDLNLGFEHSRKADLCIVLGSSLVVTPAADMPATSAERGKLVIVNLQKTPLDRKATLVVHDLIDHFVELVMHKLGLEIPKFYLTRYCSIEMSGKPGSPVVSIKGKDELGAPFSCFTQVTLMSDKTRLIVKREPFSFVVPPEVKDFYLIMYTYGHYKEPGCKIHVTPKSWGTKKFRIVFDPAVPKAGWVVTPI